MSNPASIGTHQLIHHGKVLGGPQRLPRHTQNRVAYAVARCFQLDHRHILIAAGMEEQGGDDLCVGNHGFIVQSIDQIKDCLPVELNWPDPDYKLKHSPGSAYLAKYPLTGGFVPLDATLADGRAHPAAGTGLFVSTCLTFSSDRTYADRNSEMTMEFIHVAWDGQQLSMIEHELIDTINSYVLRGDSLSTWVLDGQSFLAPFSTEQGTVVFR